MVQRSSHVVGLARREGERCHVLERTRHVDAGGPLCGPPASVGDEGKTPALLEVVRGSAAADAVRSVGAWQTELSSDLGPSAPELPIGQLHAATGMGKCPEEGGQPLQDPRVRHGHLLRDAEPLPDLGVQKSQLPLPPRENRNVHDAKLHELAIAQETMEPEHDHARGPHVSPQ